MSELEIELSTDSPEELIELFEARGWGDGLPLIPPTKDRVDAMLAADGVAGPLDPDEVIATLEPRLGEATGVRSRSTRCSRVASRDCCRCSSAPCAHSPAPN